MSFEIFFILASFLMTWHSRRASFKGRKRSVLYECRLCRKMDRKKDMPGCSFSGTLRISFETEKITFHTIHPHIHKASMMILRLNTPFFCAKIRGLCKYVSKATSSSVREILGHTLPQSIIDDWDFLNIDLSFFRSVYQHAPEVMEYRAKYKSTGNWEQDVTKMEQLILGSNGLLAKRFIIGRNSAILLCNRNIFRVMWTSINNGSHL